MSEFASVNTEDDFAWGDFENYDPDTGLDVTGMTFADFVSGYNGTDQGIEQGEWDAAWGDLQGTYEDNSQSFKDLAEEYKTNPNVTGYTDILAQINNLANQYAVNPYRDEMEGVADSMAFDSDRFRTQAQYGIQQGAKDIAASSLGKMVNAGQLNSSIGGNYLSGEQASYLTGALGALEKAIYDYESKARADQLGAYERLAGVAATDANFMQNLLAQQQNVVGDLSNMYQSDADRYLGMLEKAFGQDLSAAKSGIDQLTQWQAAQDSQFKKQQDLLVNYNNMLNSSVDRNINWGQFLANYTAGELNGGFTWDDYDISGEDFSEIGAVLNGVMNDVYGTPWDTPIDQGGGYSVVKSAVGTDDYSLTYYKDDVLLFTYTFPKDADYGDVARTLWGKFDDGMKDIWGSTYFSDAVAPTTDPTAPATDVSAWNDYTITDADFTEIGDILGGVMSDVYGLPWDTPIDQTNGYTVIKSVIGDQYGLTYLKDGVELFTHTFATDANYNDVARDLWAKFDDGMKDVWGDTFFSDAATTPGTTLPPTPVNDYWNTPDFSLAPDQKIQAAQYATQLWNTLPADWQTVQLADGTSVEMKKYDYTTNPDDWYQVSYIMVRNPATGDTENFQYSPYVESHPEYQGSLFFNTLNELLGGHLNTTYGWGY